MEKMTKAQKYELIESILETVDNENAEMLIEFCTAERNALAKKSAKAKEKAAEKKSELDPLALAVLNAVTAEPQGRETITDAVVFDDEVTVAKVGARLTKLVEQGYVVRSEVSATSASGKKTTRKAYALAPADADAEE
jgi:hypothetical protein